MKIKSGFVLDEVGGAFLAVAVGERASEMRVLIKLNSTGAFLWNIIAEKDVTEEQLIEAMIDNYGIDRSLAERDVRVFADKLRAGGLLE